MNDYLDPLHKSRYDLEQLIKIVQAPSVAFKEIVDNAIAEQNKPLQDVLSLLTPKTYDEWKSKEHDITEKAKLKYLSTEVDDFGNFVIGGNKLKQLNVDSSIDGRFLQMLLNNTERLIPWGELKDFLGSSDLKTVRVNLRRRLKDNGIEIHSDYVKSSGYVFFGLTHAK